MDLNAWEVQIFHRRRSDFRLLGFFDGSCHIKNVDILGGTPTWDLDVPVHGTVTNHAGGQVNCSLEVEPGL